MNTTSLHIKIDSTLKTEVQETADDLGLSLSSVVKVLLKQFVRTKRLSVGGIDKSEIPNEYLKKSLKQADEDIKAGRIISFSKPKDVLDYLDHEIEDERQTAY